MPSYSLTLNIDPTDLNVIKAAGQRLTLAKPVGSGDPNVVWLSIDPFQSTTVEWTEDYWIYASTTEVTQGNNISKLSEVTPGPALDAGYYPFTPAATFGVFQNNPGIASGTYAAENMMPYTQYPALTFGLSQSAMVSKKLAERKPISAQSVLSQQQIQMTPFTNVYVWLQSQFASETIITKIIGNNAVARFGGGVTDITLKYDPNRGIFVPDVASEGLIERGMIELRMPLMI
ncbi:MAG: hypothetical protein KJ670_14965 [Alphaproteobacteria bacterium]|jgi:hypothetical protein|nr:hypothetical protein [Alphaproteobacteria bacterium]MBU4052345.1 hypothetical protein [Alphaproteobacteria bacterium]MBU4090010.1 hypothetical protein [Alphaproteobacteria bacterium]MBU4157806.1 hypothetical protein [Alphaproteobacteria bacterium]